MLQRLFGTSAQSGLVESAFEEFSAMLAQAAKMHDLAMEAFFDNKPLEVDLEEMDDAIDEGEGAVRRAVLQHLSLSPAKDLVASLVLISMVQDAERIGDFTRGLGNFPRLAKHPVGGPFAEELRSINERVRPLFDRCERAFRTDVAEDARAVVEAHIGIKAELTKYIASVADSDLSADMAIVYAFTARNVMRISAHLSNIASSVVQPFDRIRHDDEEA
jgi:phosphate uptake regulator